MAVTATVVVMLMVVLMFMVGECEGGWKKGNLIWCDRRSDASLLFSHKFFRRGFDGDCESNLGLLLNERFGG